MGVKEWLQAGIAAVRAGEQENARALLMKVLEAEEENEQAWLWLSGAAEEDEERHICLENVLTLNPNNIVAQKGLAKLGTMPDPISPAAAVLYPESQVKEWRWRETSLTKTARPGGYKSTSSYDDVWSRDVEICAHCAQEVAYDENYCPKCKRNLIAKRYRYSEPGSNFHLFWIILVGMGQLFIIQAAFDLGVEHNLFAAVSHILWGIVFLVLAAGAYLRQFLAYITALSLLCIFLVIAITGLLLPINLSNLGLDTVDSAIAGFTGSLLSGIGSFLKLMHLMMIVVGLYYGFLKTASDFERIQTRQIATISKGLTVAGDYHLAARRFSQAGMWATAVLHWQRAAAKESTQIIYQRHLGHAYSRLGFYKRSLDVLQSARKLSNHPAMQAELKRLIQKAQQQLAEENG